MKQLLGFVLIWIGIGMCIMLFLRNSFIALFIIVFCLWVGYKLFSCK